MRIVLAGAAILFGVVALQLIGAAIFAGPAFVAQRVLELFARCCGEDLAGFLAITVFLGLIAGIWWALAHWRR